MKPLLICLIVLSCLVAQESSDSIDELPPLESMPVQNDFVNAEYPQDLQDRGVEGTVRLQMLVNESGTVEDVEVIESLHPTLDSLAQIAISQFTFTPAMAGGSPVAVYIEYEYHFSVEDVEVEKIESVVNFTGTVVEKGTRNIVPFATVAILFSDTLYEDLTISREAYLERIGEFEGQELDGDILTTTADSLGKFEFRSLPAGELTLKIPLTGYELYQVIDTLNNEETMNQDVVLEKLSYNDYTITSYYKGEEVEVSRRQLEVDEIRRVAGLGGDAVKVIQALPGVASPSFGGGELIVRGAGNSDSKTYLDGIEIPMLYHVGDMKATYNSDAVQAVDFYPGGFGTSYGDAIGGVVNIRSRPPKEDRFHAVVDVSTLDASFVVEAPIVKDKVSFMATARRSYYGELLTAVVEGLDLDLGMTTTPFYWDVVGRVDVTPNDDHRISVTSFTSYDSLAVLFENTAEGSDELGSATDAITSTTFFNVSGASWENKITDKVDNKLSLFYTMTEGTMGIFGYARMWSKSKYLQFRDNLQWKLNDKMLLNVGTNGYVGNLDMSLDILSEHGITRNEVEDWKYSHVGVYVNLEWRPNDRLLLIPGIRYDYYDMLAHDGSIVPEFWDYGDWNNKGIAGDPSLRLTSRFKLTDAQTIKGSVGNYNQEPAPKGQAIHELWGTPSLPTTKATHLVAGYEADITDLLSIDVQGYFNYQWNIPYQLSPKDSTTDVDNDDIYQDNGKGRTFGMEIMLRHHQSDRFFGWVAYTLARTERYSFEEKKYALFDYDQTHNLQVVGSWKLPRNWVIGGRVRYVTGSPTTPVIGREENFDRHNFTRIDGAKNSSRLDPLFKVDFRIEKKYILKNSILTSYIDIQNLLYPLYKTPDQKTYDDFYIDQKVISMPLIPTFGMRWEF